MHNAVTLLASLIALSFLPQPTLADSGSPIQVSVPSSPPSKHVVQQNFLGISFELSFMDEYFGNDTSSLPPTIVNYLSTLRSRVGSGPLRIRIGGNSMDSSNYIPSQGSPMIQMLGNAANSNDQPVNYGPGLWDVMDKVASDIGGASYLIGLSLLDPNNPNMPILAGGAAQKLGGNLDGFLLGNEPDLYTSHLNRPNIANYTTSIYMDEFKTVSDRLTNTSAGNILQLRDLSGPTICCAWNLDALLDDGYTSKFNDILKYVSLQHYPQNNCFGSYQYEIPYYVQHSNVVTLAGWQQSGINKVLSNTGPKRQELIMSEFNSASCGGIPSISDTFAVGSLWTIDYALQMASVGYSAAFLHTRERGISYNLFAPPDGPNGSPGDWTTNPPFYGLLVMAEALRSKNGSIVTDLDLGGSKTNKKATISGYAIYDAADTTVQQLVLFNYANVSSSTNSSASFNLPATVFTQSTRKSVVVRYLVAESMSEKKNIGWGGQTFANVGNGKLVAANASWAPPDTTVDCTQGCTIDVPAPGMAVVFAGSAPSTTGSSSSSSSSSGGIKNSGSLTYVGWEFSTLALLLSTGITIQTMLTLL